MAGFLPRKEDIFFVKYQIDTVGWTVTLFGDDDLGVVLLPGLNRPVDRRAVNEHDHISILFDGSGFAQIGEHGLALAAAGFHRAGELRKRQNRDVQLLGQVL